MTIEQEEKFELEEAIEVLAATPGTLQALLGGLNDAWMDFKEEPEAWSPRTVLVHFIHNEKTNWIVRVGVILSDSEVRRFPPFRQLPEGDVYEATNVGRLLAQFAELRRKNITELRSLALKPEDFIREAEHPLLGMVNLSQLLTTWVVHDLNHLHQIAKTIAKRYRSAVGPWRANLPILDLT